MKPRLLSLVLVPLLLGGCAHTLTLSRSPMIIHETETSTIGMSLKKGLDPWQLQSRVTLTSSDAVAAAFPAPTPATAIVTVNSPTAATPPPLGTASATVTAGTVTQDTTVTIDGEWRYPPGGDPKDSTTVIVRPARGPSPASGQRSMLVSPSVNPGWVYEYEIAAASSGTDYPEFVGITLLFMTDVTVTVPGRGTNTLGNPVLVEANRNAGNQWYLARPNNKDTFRRVKIRVEAAESTRPTGLMQATGHDPRDKHNYVAAVVGPRP